MSEEIKPEKTKAELFAEAPDRFVNMDDLVVATLRTEKGMSIYVNPHSRAELIKAKAEVEVALLREIFALDAMAASEKKIVKPNGIMNFARFKR